MRKLLALALAAAMSTFIVGAAPAQDYPNRPIRVLVSTPAGSAPDLIARVFGQLLAEEVRQNVLVENRAGANGVIAVDAAARAAPDGYTLLVTTASTLSANPFLYKNGMLSVTGLEPITRLADNDFVIAAHSSLGVKRFDELVKAIQAKPGALNASTSSRGGSANLAGELLKFSGNLDFVTIPYTGGAASATALDRGEVQFTIETLAMVEPLAKSGKANMLATLGTKRNPRFPDLPTVHESAYPGFNVIGWVALMAPKGTPAEIIAFIHAKLANAIKSEEVRNRLAAIDAFAVVNTPKEFAAQWQEERDTWERVIKARDLKIEQ
jgi:tripartite-type tricarboxylate transporter receptor subunit TctC